MIQFLLDIALFVGGIALVAIIVMFFDWIMGWFNK